MSYPRTRISVVVSSISVLCASAGCGGSTASPQTVAARVTPTTGAPTPSQSTPTSASSAATTLSPTPSPTTTTSNASSCSIFPPDNFWHADISKLPVNSHSATYIAAIGASRGLHPDFGSGQIDGEPFGIPVTTVDSPAPAIKVTFQYADESDPGPYRIPRNALIEGGPSSSGDRHVIVLDRSTCTDYELYDATPQSNGSWTAGSGAVFNLRSDQLRPAGWTSADAAGLPILAGLVTYDEVAAGHVDHAIRITVPHSADSYLWPARHAAGDSGSGLPPMGLVLRLKASVDISGLPPEARVIAQALKTYGAVVADNGSAWYISGTQDARWNNDQLDALKKFTGSDFEAVDTSAEEVSPNSGQAK